MFPPPPFVRMDSSVLAALPLCLQHRDPAVRHRKSAGERRLQARRAEARVIQRCLATMRAVLHHRGNHLGIHGQALVKALADVQPPSCAGTVPQQARTTDGSASKGAGEEALLHASAVGEVAERQADPVALPQAVVQVHLQPAPSLASPAPCAAPVLADGGLGADAPTVAVSSRPGPLPSLIGAASALGALSQPAASPVVTAASEDELTLAELTGHVSILCASASTLACQQHPSRPRAEACGTPGPERLVCGPHASGLASSAARHPYMAVARPCAADLSDAALREAILLEMQGQDLSCLSATALRFALEEHLGFGRDGLIARRHKISGFARELAKQLQSTGSPVLASTVAGEALCVADSCGAASCRSHWAQLHSAEVAPTSPLQQPVLQSHRDRMQLLRYVHRTVKLRCFMYLSKHVVCLGRRHLGRQPARRRRTPRPSSPQRLAAPSRSRRPGRRRSQVERYTSCSPGSSLVTSANSMGSPRRDATQS